MNRLLCSRANRADPLRGNPSKGQTLKLALWPIRRRGTRRQHR